MKAITVKFLGPTDTKGSRLKAIDSDHNTVTIPYPHAEHSEGRYAQAAIALCKKMGWDGTLIEGWAEDGKAVYVFSSGLHIDIETGAMAYGGKF